MENQVVFIIGGAGYIGSHMVKKAFSVDMKVITLDNLSTGHRDAVKYGVFEYCDIHDSVKLDVLFKKYKPDIVMHFSAFSLVGESVNDPYKYYHNNVTGTLNLLKIMIDNNCKKFIFSSTAAVFGNPDYVPIDEKHPKNPINPYGKSKLMVEQILEDFDNAYGLRYVIFRYFNAAGHDVESGLTERHEPETHLLPLIMQTADGKRKFISIYGTDYETDDGTCVRDYIHVNDLCMAHLNGLRYLNELQDEKLNSTINEYKNKSTDFNLGNGKGCSVKEVIQEVKNITKIDFKVKEEKRRIGDPSVLIASSAKAQKLLGLEFSFTTIFKIISTLVKSDRK